MSTKFIFKYKVLPLSQLDSVSFQPKTRATETNTKILRASLKDFGQLDSIAVVVSDDDRYIIINGHRRVFALRALGEKDAHCQVFVSGTDKPELFNAFNTVRKLQTKESQQLFLEEPRALSKEAKARQRKASEFFGAELYEQIVKENRFAAYSFYDVLQKFLRLCASVDLDLANALSKDNVKLYGRLMKHSPQRPIRELANALSGIGKSDQNKVSEARKLLGLGKRRTL